MLILLRYGNSFVKCKIKYGGRVNIVFSFLPYGEYDETIKPGI
jgi:hypothetical protein